MKKIKKTTRQFFVPFLGWLSDPFKSQVTSKWAIKRSRLEAPGNYISPTTAKKKATKSPTATKGPGTFTDEKNPTTSPRSIDPLKWVHPEPPGPGGFFLLWASVFLVVVHGFLKGLRNTVSKSVKKKQAGLTKGEHGRACGSFSLMTSIPHVSAGAQPGKRVIIHKNHGNMIYYMLLNIASSQAKMKWSWGGVEDVIPALAQSRCGPAWTP